MMSLLSLLNPISQCYQIYHTSTLDLDHLQIPPDISNIHYQLLLPHLVDHRLGTLH
jgi:hypothetical protein